MELVRVTATNVHRRTTAFDSVPIASPPSGRVTAPAAPTASAPIVPERERATTARGALTRLSWFVALYGVSIVSFGVLVTSTRWTLSVI